MAWTEWSDVAQRLDELAGAPPKVIDDFVADVYETTTTPAILVSLARHPAAVASVRGWLRSRLDGDLSELRARAGSGEVFAAALTAAAQLVLPAQEAEAAAQAVLSGLARMTSHYFQFRDSAVGQRPAVGATAPRAAGSVGHRLVIAEQLDDKDMVALLLPGCERATLFSTADIYGRADFARRADWTRSGEVAIEHIRSRITRYSPEYIGLHEATARLAEQLVATLGEVPGLLHDDDRPFVALDVADSLFFRALRLHAIECVLDDPAFDHIVIALAGQSPASEFVRMLGTIDRLRTDPRVEIVSIARDTKARVTFWHVLDEITSPALPGSHPPNRYDTDTIIQRFNALARTRSVDLSPPAGPWVLLATTSSEAYTESTVTCARELAQVHPVRVLHLKGATSPDDGMSEVLRDEAAIQVAEHRTEAVRDFPFVDVLLGHLRPQAALLLQQATGPFDRAAAHALGIAVSSLVSTVVVPSLLRAKVVQAVFDSWRDQSCLPAAVVLIPQRSVGVVAAVARRSGVPSIAIEPHLYVPEYSRYSKVASDYYGVLSSYLVDGAVQEFGMGTSERVHVVGSPRLVAPRGYDPAAARRDARAVYAAEHDFDFSRRPVHLVFFCQPSGWHHVAPVWDLLLEGIGKSGAHLFFKPHQEEGSARVAQYLAAAAKRGLSDQVTLLGGDAAGAVAIADVAGTAYSTAALDAAIRTTPVVCVAPGGIRYPVDVAAIAGARVAASADELADLLASFADDPAPLQAEARAWVERERQFVDGPGPALRRLLTEVIERGPRGLRRAEELPRSMFTDGPHPVFRV